MASRKITVTLPESQVSRVQALVAQGAAGSVSGFVQHAVRTALDDLAGWDAVLASGLESSGGPLTDDERVWADRALGTEGTAVEGAAAGA